MMPLVLVAAFASGADPSAMPGLAPYSPPYVAEKRLPSVLRPLARLRAKEADLAFFGAGKPAPAGSFLWQSTYELDYELRGPTRPYMPQAGDIVMSTDGSVFWKTMHNLAGTSHPTHSMIVYARPDGTTAILEGGPHDTLKCLVVETLPHMFSYEKEGRVWVRRRAVPLTCEQSAKLTEFALAVEGRRFALGRLAAQLTVFRTRGPFRTAFVGHPHGLDQKSYYCSELVCEACVYAGLLDAATTRPSATYPRDLYMDASLNPYLNKHLKLAPAWEVPARWTSVPAMCAPCVVEVHR